MRTSRVNQKWLLFGVIIGWFCFPKPVKRAMSFSKTVTPMELYCFVLSKMSLDNISATAKKRWQNQLKKPEVRIAFVGDSITEGADLLEPDQSYVNLFVENLKKQYPQTKFSILNAALSARSLRHLLQPSYVGYDAQPQVEEGFGPTPSMSRSWVVVGKSWLDTVQDFKPDVIVLAFGVNDSWEENASAHFASRLDTLLKTLQTWSLPPEAIIETSLMMANHTRQEQLLAIAAVARTFALSHDLILIDVNRLWIASTKGYDVVTGLQSKGSLYTEPEVLGEKDSHNGNGLNHPNMVGHQNLYFAALTSILQRNPLFLNHCPKL